MKSKKLKLNELKVKSFQTSSQSAVKGGTSVQVIEERSDWSCDIYICPTLIGPKCRDVETYECITNF